MFLRYLICTFVFSSFFTIKALAVQPGEILWEVKKPGQEANYLIGTNHDVILNERSLPPELISLLENAEIGLFELIINKETEEQITEAVRNNMLLPSEKTLSFYMEEEIVQDFFNAIQFALNESDKGLLSEALHSFKEELNIDIRSYEDFNRLTPFTVMTLATFAIQDKMMQANQGLQEEENQRPNELIIESDLPDKQEELAIKNEGKAEQNDIQTEPVSTETCFAQQEPMDMYFQKTLSCMGKPIYPLETAEIQVSAAFAASGSQNYRSTVDLLSQNGEQLIRLIKGHASLTENIYFEWNSFLTQIGSILGYSIILNHYQGIEVNKEFFEFDVSSTISHFLTAKQCSAPPENLIQQWAFQTFDFYNLFLSQLITGKQIEEEKEEEFIKSIKEMGYTQIEIFSLCFPEHIWPDNLEKQIESSGRFFLDLTKNTIDTMFLSRDQKLARNMIPYFEEGGAFSAVGFSHLSGVLEELKVYGYEFKLIEFSTPLLDASDTLPIMNEID